MTGQWEFGVEWDTGYVGPSISRAGAELEYGAASKSGWSPRAVRVVRRQVGEWEPAGEEKP